LFQDEGRFGRINDTRRCWAPLPTRPVVGQQVVREYLYGFVAVSPFDGRCASLILPWVDAQTMSIFLRHAAQEFCDTFCLMLLDGAGWHHARDLVLPENLRLLFLPPYSPELNPVEHIWDYLRENHFGNDALPTLEAVGQRHRPPACFVLSGRAAGSKIGFFFPRTPRPINFTSEGSATERYIQAEQQGRPAARPAWRAHFLGEPAGRASVRGQIVKPARSIAARDATSRAGIVHAARRPP
jgi:hypothetical protein